LDDKLREILNFLLGNGFFEYLAIVLKKLVVLNGFIFLGGCDTFIRERVCADAKMLMLQNI
jgi:hypothetical protein